VVGVAASGRFAYSVGWLAYPIIRGAFKDRGEPFSFGERGREPGPNIVRGEFWQHARGLDYRVINLGRLSGRPLVIRGSLGEFHTALEWR
jgi:hypothetical protein